MFFLMPLLWGGGSYYGGTYLMARYGTKWALAAMLDRYNQMWWEKYISKQNLFVAMCCLCFMMLFQMLMICCPCFGMCGCRGPLGCVGKKYRGSKGAGSTQESDAEQRNRVADLNADAADKRHQKHKEGANRAAREHRQGEDVAAAGHEESQAAGRNRRRDGHLAMADGNSKANNSHDRRHDQNEDAGDAASKLRGDRRRRNMLANSKLDMKEHNQNQNAMQDFFENEDEIGKSRMDAREHRRKLRAKQRLGANLDLEDMCENAKDDREERRNQAALRRKREQANEEEDREERKRERRLRDEERREDRKREREEARMMMLQSMKKDTPPANPMMMGMNPQMMQQMMAQQMMAQQMMPQMMPQQMTPAMMMNNRMENRTAQQSVNAQRRKLDTWNRRSQPGQQSPARDDIDYSDEEGAPSRTGEAGLRRRKTPGKKKTPAGSDDDDL